MLDQTPMVVSFSLTKNSKIPYARANGAWWFGQHHLLNYMSAKRRTSLDRRHTAFSQLMDEASYKVLDVTRRVETGSRQAS